MTEKGYMRLEWAKEHMGVMSIIRDRFVKERPFKGLKIGMALHVEAKTGVFALLLREGGADIRLSSCNPLSSDNDVVDSLVKDHKLPVYARKGETREEYYEHLNTVLDLNPNVIVDDGGDLVRIVHEERTDLIDNIIGGNEETTTGVVRLRAMEKEGALKFPMFDVNDAKMKHYFDNRYGTGQSVLDGIMHSTNLIIAGKNVLVGGYGYCGRGIAMRMKGMGANVTVTEIDPVKAIEAVMDGFKVSRLNEAIREADILVTATGMKGVVSYNDLLSAKNGIVVSNAGHFDNEIDVASIETKSINKSQVRDNVQCYKLDNGNEINLISEGRLVNLASGQGHPVEIMDMSFSIQALVAEYLSKNYKALETKVYSVPDHIDTQVANLKLNSLGIKIDKLTDEQIKYSDSWREGT